MSKWIWILMDQCIGNCLVSMMIKHIIYIVWALTESYIKRNLNWVTRIHMYKPIYRFFKLKTLYNRTNWIRALAMKYAKSAQNGKFQIRSRSKQRQKFWCFTKHQKKWGYILVVMQQQCNGAEIEMLDTAVNKYYAKYSVLPFAVFFGFAFHLRISLYIYQTIFLSTGKNTSFA